MKKQTSEIEEKIIYILSKNSDGLSYDIRDIDACVMDIKILLQDEKKKWKEDVMKELGLNTYTVGVASARREDLGTPKADPESEYNKGYMDATNKMNEWLRVKLEEV